MKTDYKLETNQQSVSTPFEVFKFNARETLTIKELSKNPEEFETFFNDNFQMPFVIKDLNTKLLNLGFQKTLEDTITERLPPKQPDSLPYFKEILTYYMKKGIVLQTSVERHQGYLFSSLQACHDLDGYMTHIYIETSQYQQLLKTLFDVLRKPLHKK